MSARAALRAATAAEHERVDRLFGAYDLSSRTGYRAFLLAQAAAFLPVERALAAAGAGRLVPDWPERIRGHLLRADLAELDAGEPEAICSPRIDGPAGVIGAAYVLEGSRLGGAVLKRALPARFPQSFLAAPQQPGSWRKLLEIMDKVLYGAGSIEAAAGVARQVFECFAAGGRRYLETAPE